MNSLKLVATSIYALAIAAHSLSAQDKTEAPMNLDSANIQEFQKRVGHYLKLRKTVEQKLSTLKQTESQAAIQGHEEGIAAGVREARRSAKQGDIFTPQIAGVLRRLIALAMMHGDDKARVNETLQNSEPVQLSLRVNDSYPQSAPLQTTPPSLLANLPKLPEELEYRLVGRSLVLRCAKGNLIVDFIPNVMPNPVK